MRRGFTLLEALLGLGIIVALSGGIFTFVWQIGAQKSALTEAALQCQAGDAVLDRMESDLAGAVAADSEGTAGIVGSETTLRVLSRGIKLPLAEADREWAGGDLQGTEYVASGGSLSIKRWDAHRFKDAPSGGGEVASDRVAAFRLRYFDGTEWVTSFDSKSQDGLPVAVEVAIWFGDAAEDGLDPDAAVDAVEPRSGLLPPLGAPLDPDGNPLMVEVVSAPPALPRPSRSPDRLRVIVVPDGPTTAWKEAR